MSVQAIVWAFGIVLAIIWGGRAIESAIGLRKVDDISRDEWDLVPARERVTIVVPARNEADDIVSCLSSLLALDYRDFDVIAVNDRSSDATGELMESLLPEHSDRLRVIHVSELPPGWLGKTHAMWRAAKETTGEWLLFTDGDVVFRKDSLRRAIAYAQRSSTDHMVLFPRMQWHTLGEEMMIGFLHTAVLLLSRPWKVADPKAYDHVGVGAFNLIRRSVYESLGTFESLRMEVVEDLLLGRAVKRNGFAQRVADGKDLVHIHWASGVIGIAHTLEKNIFAALGFRLWLVLLLAFGTAVVDFVPLVGAVFAPGWSRLPYGIALIGMAALYRLAARNAGVRWPTFLLFPIAMSVMIYAMLRSALLTTMRGAVVWRGTRYSLDELRRASRGA